jgi:hypothetical protein
MNFKIGQSRSPEKDIMSTIILRQALIANLSSGQFDAFAPIFKVTGMEGINIGSMSDMLRSNLKTVRDYEENRLREILKTRLGPCSVIADATPGAAEAQCLIVRFVVKDLHVQQLLIDLKYFDKKLNGSCIAYYLIATLNKWGIGMEDWRFAIMDRASTNKKAIADMSKLENPPIEWPCHSHTLCKPGDTLAEEAKLSNEFRKYYNKGIMFRGKMFDVVKDVKILVYLNLKMVTSFLI